MTAKRDLKRRVRERQARTGESYVTARRRVVAPPERAGMSVIEALDVTEEAARLGFRCRVTMLPELVERLAPPVVLASLRDVLVAAPGGLSTARLFNVAFGLPALPSATQDFVSLDGLRQFYRQLHAGLGGTAVNGSLLGWHVTGPDGIVPVVCSVWARSRVAAHGPVLAPSLLLSVVHELGQDLLTTEEPGPGRGRSIREAVALALAPHLFVGGPGRSPMLEIRQRVRVTAGPFAGFEATVERVAADGRELTVAISIGGRTTSVVLQLGEVEPVAATLCVSYDGRRHEIRKDEFVIGRDRKLCDLQIKDGLVSRKHAAVIHRHGAHYLKDLGSTHGVVYKGMRIDNKRIDEGDVFHLGEHELRFTYLPDG